VKKFWGARVTTIFVRQGHYAADPNILASYPPADISVGRIGDLLQYDLPELLNPKHERSRDFSMTTDDYLRKLSFWAKRRISYAWMAEPDSQRYFASLNMTQ
jgi:hypothetical protein